ncbi:unnamed protein product [Rotaria magnacalcarata]
MKPFLYLLFSLISEAFIPIESQCTGGIWPIQDPTIGSYTLSWRYNLASNTVQFIIQGQAIAAVDLTSTYIAIGWSDKAPTMTSMDVAMYFPGTQMVQDRYSRGHITPSVDTQQDFCVIQSNLTDKNVYVSFERFLTTGDTNDISFSSNLYLMFAMGPYTFSKDTSSFNPQYHFFRIALQSSLSLINCVSIGCSTTPCTITSCSCLQQIISDTAQCICFPPSPCISGSTITPRPTTTISLTTLPSTTMNGTCQNLANSCSSNGICLQITAAQFICQCKNNYTGLICQIPLFSNATANPNSCQCANGGTCLTNGTCICTDLYRGRFCQLNNPCIGFCRNNGTCSVSCTDASCSLPTCNCAHNYTGTQCEIIGNNACQSNSCAYGNCTTTTNGTFQCQCNYGYFGNRCELINSCLSNPCRQGTCIVSSNCAGLLCSYSCLCPNGTTGQNCEIGGNPCLSTPCKNNGTCSVLSTTYACQCLSPYGDTNCDTLINVCTPNPCFNNGICVRDPKKQDGTYQCNCRNGYTGTMCEYCNSYDANVSNEKKQFDFELLVNGCISSPCLNGGQCISLTNNCSSTTCPVSCACLSGTSGIYCEKQDTSCLTLPCLHSGTCVTNLITNTSYCQCRSNTIGVRCETIQSICTSAICSNNGACYVDASTGNNTFGCICFPGFTGQYCQSFISSCLQNPCGYNGTCFPVSNSSYYCICPTGLIGPSCNPSTLTSCSESPCHYLSTCQQLSNATSIKYKCLCPVHLTGDRCQYTNYCQSQPCQNQGSCLPLGPENSFMCRCQPGYGNYDCSMYLGQSCSSNICLNGGICYSNITSIRCMCTSDFAGARCEWNSICSSNTCSNGGTCRQTGVTMAECLCTIGFTGPTCNLRDSCANFPCKHGGACNTLFADTGTMWSAYQCVCPPGFYGTNCDSSISSCANMMCPSYKICNEQPTGPVCTCPGKNPCNLLSSSYCLNGGTCVPSNTDPPIASCLCSEVFAGLNCNSTQQSNPCTSNPCQTNGYCALSTSKTSYSCICQPNYIGDQCERTNPCISSPCLNQGICQGYWNTTNTWYICRCIGTYAGTYCETSLLNPCGGLCMHGSPCVNGTCVCPAQYTGTYCGFNNPCYNPICRNGGFCSVNLNSTSVSFTCTCQSSFTGQYCETQISPSLIAICLSQCNNGGTCVSGVCVCTSQYIGPLCQYTNPCLNNNSCLNGGTCFGQYYLNGTLYTKCFCSQGYTGTLCEATLCSATSCNGGSCIATQNTIFCSCPIGKTGDRCQYIDSCAKKPCLPNETCVQIENQYQCMTCYDKSSFCSIYQNYTEYCDARYALLINNILLPVPEACQRSCKQCNSIDNSNSSGRSLTELDDDSDSIVAGKYKYLIDNMEMTSISTRTEVSSQEEKCFDRRDDCSIQKAYGFCAIFNEKYPDDCVKTCHPDCASVS